MRKCSAVALFRRYPCPLVPCVTVCPFHMCCCGSPTALHVSMHVICTPRKGGGSESQKSDQSGGNARAPKANKRSETSAGFAMLAVQELCWLCHRLCACHACWVLANFRLFSALVGKQASPPSTDFAASQDRTSEDLDRARSTGAGSAPSMTSISLGSGYLPWLDKMDIACQCADAVAFLHSRVRLVYSALKPCVLLRLTAPFAYLSFCLSG